MSHARESFCRSLSRVPLSPGMTTTLGPALNKSSLTAVEVFGGKTLKARKIKPLFVCRRTPSSWPQRGPVGTSKRRCFFAALDTTTNTRRPRPRIKTKAVATPPGEEEEEELPDEVRDLKIQDIISLWVTQILQTYGDKPSSDNAPIVEGEIDDLVGGPIFLALYPYFRCVFSHFFSEGKVDDRVSCGTRGRVLRVVRVKAQRSGRRATDAVRVPVFSLLLYFLIFAGAARL